MAENNVVTNTVTTTSTIPNDSITVGSYTLTTPAIDFDEVVKPEPAKTEPAKEDKADAAEVERLKRLLSKANSEASSYKQQLREKQTETERAEAERAEQEQAMRAELAELRKEKAVSDYTAKCVALNMEADLATRTANAMADGDMNAVFDCLQAFIEATTTRLSNEALNRQPGLSAGTPPHKGNTDDELTAQLRRYAGLPVHR